MNALLAALVILVVFIVGWLCGRRAGIKETVITSLRTCVRLGISPSAWTGAVLAELNEQIKELRR